MWFVVAWMAARYLTVRAELPHADVLVVMSGSALYDERAQWAAKLYHEGKAPFVILSNDNQRGGWSNDDEQNLFFYERARRVLLECGVPPERVQVLMVPISSTYEEAISVREYASKNGIRTILFVTSQQHSRRAWWTLRRVFSQSGIEVGLSPAAPGPRSPSPATWWCFPRGWLIVAGEYVKLFYYWIRYR